MMQGRIRRDTIVAAALFLGTVGSLLAVEGRQGIGRDEAQYFRASEHYWSWFEDLGLNISHSHARESFTRAAIDRAWGDNPEHPPLMKTLYAFSWRAFHRCECVPMRGYHWIPIRGKHITLPLFARDSTAFRFPAMLMAGLGAVLAFFFARRWVGTSAAAAAGVLFVAQPHYFFHAQIACFDAPITTLALALGFAYWKSLRSARWGILCGVVFGLALATKHNAWLMPFFLGAHYLWIRRGDVRRLRPPRVPLAFISMITIGPALLLALWPWLWPDPVGRTMGWFARHLAHEHYHFEYWGQNWPGPPKELGLALLRMTFPFVSAALTVPATTLVLALVGAFVLAGRRRDPDLNGDLHADAAPTASRASWLRPGADVDLAPGVFLAIQILGPMAVLAVPSAPVFGGVKHFMPAMPYLAIVAGLGLGWVARTVAVFVRAEQVRLGRALPVALAVLVSAPAVVETRRSHPDGLSHYNFFAGGFAGGASLGMNRQFWGYSVAPMLDWLGAHPGPNHQTYWHDVLPDALTMYVREHRLPAGMGNTGVGEDAIRRSDLGIIIHEKHMAVYEGVFWESYRTTQPAYVRTREGVPLVTVYRRPGTLAGVPEPSRAMAPPGGAGLRQRELTAGIDP